MSIRTFRALPIAVALSSTAFAEDRVARSLDELRDLVAAGDTAYVTDQAGRQTKGRVTEISADAIHLSANGGRIRMSEDSVRQVELRRGDSLRNGLLIGAAVGGGMAILPPALSGESSDCGDSCVTYFASIAGLGAGIGAGIGLAVDVAVKDRRLVYFTPHPTRSTQIFVTPILVRRGRGLLVSVRF